MGKKWWECMINNKQGNDKQRLGRLGEQIAVNFLKKKGYKILDRNFKTSRFGEIDIVAQDYFQTQINADYDPPCRQAGANLRRFKIWSKIFDFIRNPFKFAIRIIRMSFIDWHRIKDEIPIVFIEVKTKSSHEFGGPEEEFTIFKKQKMRRAIQDWFWTKKITTNNWRIDLVAVDFSKNEKKPEIRHYLGCV